MSKKTDAMKKALVALGYGSAVAEYKEDSVVGVLKELAVILQCAASVEDVKALKITGVLEYIAANYGEESVEPFDLSVTATKATVTMKRNNKNVTAGADRLYNGDKLKVTVEADEGYEVTTLTANGEAIESGDVLTVDGEGIAIIATATEVTE